MLAVVALHVLPPIVFALIHGGMFYRHRGILVFVALCAVVGNLFENLGVRTGFPFGHYYFTNLMGPKLFVVPIFLGLAYVGMAYLSWMLACVIAGDKQGSLAGKRVVAVPLLAAVIMVAWDLAMDPIWGTVLHAWIWLDGGAYFGVPLSNFAGWYLTIYVIYQSFALYVRRHEISTKPLPSRYWHLPVIFYAVSAAGNLILAIPQHGPSVVLDAAGVQWKVSHIVDACVLVSVCVMGTFALWAWTRLANPEPAVGAQNLASERSIPDADLL